MICGFDLPLSSLIEESWRSGRYWTFTFRIVDDHGKAIGTIHLPRAWLVSFDDHIVRVHDCNGYATYSWNNLIDLEELP